MARRELQEINAGSMADIAFLLLLFFLISSNMDTDTGLLRKLPPMEDSNKVIQSIDIKERNVFEVLVNRNNQLMVEGELMALKDLRQATKTFLTNPDNLPDLPSKELIDIDFFGPTEVTTSHIISLQSDRGTSYEMYIAVQNELSAAYGELRNEVSLSKFGVRFNELEKTRQNLSRAQAIEKIFPIRISEAEPKNIGGNSDVAL